MDILHRKLHTRGDIVYFMRSSIENPFLYLRFKGVVVNTLVEGENITYHIKVLQVHETYETVTKHLTRVRFRVRAKKINRFLDKWVYAFDLTEELYSDNFRDKYQNYLFDIPSLLVFETREDLDQNMQNLNNKILKDLNRFTNIVKSRTNGV